MKIMSKKIKNRIFDLIIGKDLLLKKFAHSRDENLLLEIKEINEEIKKLKGATFAKSN